MGWKPIFSPSTKSSKISLGRLRRPWSGTSGPKPSREGGGGGRRRGSGPGAPPPVAPGPSPCRQGNGAVVRRQGKAGGCRGRARKEKTHGWRWGGGQGACALRPHPPLRIPPCSWWHSAAQAARCSCSSTTRPSASSTCRCSRSAAHRAAQARTSAFCKGGVRPRVGGAEPDATSPGAVDIGGLGGGGGSRSNRGLGHSEEAEAGKGGTRAGVTHCQGGGGDPPAPPQSHCEGQRPHTAGQSSSGPWVPQPCWSHTGVRSLSSWRCTASAPPCDIPSGFFTGAWTVTHPSLRMLCRVAAFCRPLRPVLLLVSFPRSRSPVVGVPGGRLQPVLMRHPPQLSVKTWGGGGGGSWGRGSSRGSGGGQAGGQGGGSSRGSGGCLAGGQGGVQPGVRGGGVLGYG